QQGLVGDFELAVRLLAEPAHQMLGHEVADYSFDVGSGMAAALHHSDEFGFATAAAERLFKVLVEDDQFEKQALADPLLRLRKGFEEAFGHFAQRSLHVGQPIDHLLRDQIQWLASAASPIAAVARTAARAARWRAPRLGWPIGPPVPVARTAIPRCPPAP